MKILRMCLAVLMVLFALVQLNDPDGVWWALGYAAVALALALSALRAGWLRGVAGRTLVLGLTGTLAVLVVRHWPEQPGFWRQAVWWQEETAREGMGLMIALLAALCALPVAFGTGTPTVADARPARDGGTGHGG